MPLCQRHGHQARQNVLYAAVVRHRRVFVPALVEFAQIFDGAAGLFDGVGRLIHFRIEGNVFLGHSFLLPNYPELLSSNCKSLVLAGRHECFALFHVALPRFDDGFFLAPFGTFPGQLTIKSSSRSSGTSFSLAETRPRTETPAACTVSGSPDISGCHQ